MISGTTVKIMNLLPKRIIRLLSKSYVNINLKKYANMRVIGKENLDGVLLPTIFICNHISNADGLVLNKVLNEVNPTFVAGVKLSNNIVTNIGINVVKTTSIIPNSVDQEGLKRIINLIKGGESIVIFPEGTRSRVGSMNEAKRGIQLIARMTGAPIIPIGVYGTEQLMPINLDGDMSSELFQRADVYVNIGCQFEYPKKLKGQDKKAYEASAINFIMNKIAELLPENYRGVYK